MYFGKIPSSCSGPPFQFQLKECWWQHQRGDFFLVMLPSGEVKLDTRIHWEHFDHLEGLTSRDARIIWHVCKEAAPEAIDKDIRMTRNSFGVAEAIQRCALARSIWKETFVRQ